MPLIVATFWGALLGIVSNVVGRVLLALGIGFTLYTGLSVTLGFLKDMVISRFRDLPPEVFGLLSYMGVGSAINIIFSALAARLILQGLTNGAIKSAGFGQFDR